MSPTRYLGSAQPYRGKLTPAKLRALQALARGHRPECRPQTLRALMRFGLISPAPIGYALTAAGAVAVARYAPRRRTTYV